MRIALLLCVLLIEAIRIYSLQQKGGDSELLRIFIVSHSHDDVGKISRVFVFFDQNITIIMIIIYRIWPVIEKGWCMTHTYLLELIHRLAKDD